jgi:AhpD family alkylhydroperoxidase
MSNRLDDFQAYRSRMNERILQIDHPGIKRFFNLDSTAYRDGVLDAKMKEMLGLVASMLLRCNECIDYHVLGWRMRAARTKSATKPSTLPWWWAAASLSRTWAMPWRAWTCIGVAHGLEARIDHDSRTG